MISPDCYRSDSDERERAISAIETIDPDCDYDTWFRVLAALHSWNPSQGLDLAISWSCRGSKFKEGEIEKKWKSFKPNGGIGPGTLFEIALQNGWKHEHTDTINIPVSKYQSKNPKFQNKTKARNSFQAEESIELWNAAGYVSDCKACSEWLKSRELDPQAVDDFDLARAIPTRLPFWTSFKGKPWHDQGYRLILPLRGESGQIKNIHARQVFPSNNLPKSVSPAGSTIAGLVFMNSTALWMLDEPNEIVEVVINEGIPDYLTRGIFYSDADEHAPAIIGILSGSWGKQIAQVIPDRAQVYIETDTDKTGNKYAKKIASTLIGRCTVMRNED